MVASNGSISSSFSDGVDSPNISISPPPEEKEYSFEDMRKEDTGLVQVRVTCPNLGQKCSKMFHFVLNDTVWVAKQMVLVEFSVNPNLQDALNFGFYLPPHAGRAGKFLDEQRKLKEYPMDNVEAHLEFRYKRRIFRHLYTPDEKKLLKVNSKKYRKKFMECVCTKNLEEMKKLLEKGMDPNYHDERTGNTPLIVASMLDNCLELLKILIQYGAYLDFRSMKGETALHVVAAAGKLNVLKDFKNLGASPNYKDGKGLTPLYHSILCGSDLSISEHLLSSNAQIGVSDIHGSEEIHQACKLGFPKHLELLILHGAKVNSCTASGNTPMHICALENQIKCAELLLLHNANTRALNYAQQSPYDVSVLTSHVEMSHLLQKINSDGKSEVHEGTLHRQHSVPTLPSEKLSSLKVGAASDSKIQALKGNTDADEQSGSDSDSDDEEKLGPVKQFRTFSSAGVGTKRSPAPMKIKQLGTPILRKRLYASPPGKQYVANNDYKPKHSGELSLKKGDLIEVLYIGDNGYWEGHIGGHGGWFPSYCVQEVKHNDRQISWFGKKSPEDINKINLKVPTPRTVTLKRSEKGFGFQLKGANSHVPFIDFVPTPQYPALQYIGQVDKGSVAEKVGLKAGDFVLEINSENVINATHGYSVSLVNKSNKTLSMKVIAVAPDCVNSDAVVTNTELSSENVIEVREQGNDSASTNPRKAGPPPPPPMRSFSTSLSRILDSDSMFSGVPVVTKAETVSFSSTVDRKASVKGIWSGNAFRLQGSDFRIREDDISRGISRKQKAVSQCGDSPKMIAVDSYLGNPQNDSKQELPGYKETVNNLHIGRASSLGKGDGAKYSRSFTLDANRNNIVDNRGKNERSISHSSKPINIAPGYYNQQLENQQYATIRKHNHTDSKPPISNKPVIYNRSPSTNKDPPIVFNFNSNTPVNDFTSRDSPSSGSHPTHELQGRQYVDYEYVISGDVHEDKIPPQMVDSEEANNTDDDFRFQAPDTPESYSHPCNPETDGLIRLQNQRHGKIQGKTSVMYNSNSSVSSDSKDSGYDACENEHHLSQGNGLKVLKDGEILKHPYMNASSTLEESSTAYLDNVIANAEASINYDSISLASSVMSQNDAESCLSDTNTPSPRSPSLAMIEFPPPPNEFLAEDKDVSEKPIPSQAVDLQSLSEPPPPYTPYGSSPDDLTVNVPVKLQGKSYIEWSSDEVCSWLEHLSLGQYKETFVNNEIEGKHLPELTKDELKELGVNKLGHRMTLDDAISKLKSNTP